MVHSDESYNTNLYSTPSPVESDAYSSPNQTPTAEEASETLGTPTDDWNTGMQPDHVVSSPRSLKAEDSVETVTSVTSHDAQIHNGGVLPLPDRYWSIASRYTQTHSSVIGTRDNSFTVASEASTVVPIRPSSGKYSPWRPNEPSGHQLQTALLNYWVNKESGLSTSRFCGIDMQTPYQHSTGPARTEIVRTPRFRPYVAPPSARLNEHTNPKVGPSTVTPPLVPYVAPPATHPSGGTSEKTADTENDSTDTEEDKVPTTKRPRGTGKTREWRNRYHQDIHKLCDWAQEWKALKKPPTHSRALNIALEAIEAIRVPIYSEERLSKGKGKRVSQGKKASDAEFYRRETTREANEKLSRYYQLTTNQSGWRCPKLLSKILKEVENLPKLES